jgi:diguanylate cyclase (GGDEF)-like protein/PAS domain S-box-containing protein
LNGDRRVNSGKIEISLGEGPEQRAFNLIVNPLLGSQGEHAGRLVILQDAQSRQIAEQALNESDQRFQALFSQAQEGLLLLNAFGSITACNAAAERLLGFKADQIIGKTLLDPRWRTIHADGSAFPGEDHPAILALRSGKSQAGVEMGIRKPDGDLSWVNVSAEPLLAGKSFRSGDISEATPNDSPRGFGALTFLLDLGVRPPAQESPSQSETQALALVENAPLAILIAGADGLIRAANQHAEQLFGYAKNELLDQPFEFLLPEHFWKTHPQLRSQILKSPETAAPESEAVLELVGMRKDGSEFPLELRLGNVAAPGEVQIVLYAIDTTHQRNFESELDASNRLLEVSLKNLEVRNRELKLLSEMGNMLQRCASQDEAHLVIAELARQLFPDLSGVLYKHDWMRGMLEAVITWGSTLPNELIFSPDACWGVRLGRSHMPRRNGGRLRCQHIAGDEPGANASLCVPLIHMNETIGLLHLRGKNSELDDSREHLAIAAAEQITLALSNLALRENLRVQSIRDPLTGLYNQRYMEESLSRELSRAERYHLPLGVIIIDIDHFKQFNDSFGHIAADDLLRSFAAFLQNTVRGEDIVCRYDAEEFAVILPDTGLDGCQYLAEKLRQGASQLQSEYLRQVFEPVTISMGIACYPEHGPSAGELLQAAGHALYLAINQGRDQFALAR